MPSPNSTRLEIALYVEPEYATRVKNLLEEAHDDCLLLDIEKVVGRRVAGYSGLRANNMGGECYDHGMGIAEAYVEDES